MAMLLRYMGVAVIGAGFMLMMLFPRKLGWKNRLRQTLLYGMLATPLPLLWFIHNMMAASTPAGQFYSYGYTLCQHVKLCMSAFGSWFFPVRVPLAVQLLFIAILVSAGVFLWRKEQGQKTIQKGSEALSILIIAGFIILYSGLTLLSAWLFTTAEVEDYQRYLLPVLVPTLGLMAVIMHKLTQYLQTSGRIGRWSASLLVLVAYLWLVFPIYRDVEYARSLTAAGGGGYTARHWRESQTLKTLASVGGQTILSNAPAAVYFYTGRAARSAPFQWKSDSIPCPATSEHDTALLVWFLPGVHWSKENRRKNAMITPQIYNENCGLVPVVKTDDGVIYVFDSERGADTLEGR